MLASGNYYHRTIFGALTRKLYKSARVSYQKIFLQGLSSGPEEPFLGKRAPTGRGSYRNRFQWNSSRGSRRKGILVRAPGRLPNIILIGSFGNHFGGGGHIQSVTERRPPCKSFLKIIGRFWFCLRLLENGLQRFQCPVSGSVPWPNPFNCRLPNKIQGQRRKSLSDNGRRSRQCLP